MNVGTPHPSQALWDLRTSKHDCTSQNRDGVGVGDTQVSQGHLQARPPQLCQVPTLQTTPIPSRPVQEAKLSCGPRAASGQGVPGIKHSRQATVRGGPRAKAPAKVAPV